MITKSIVLRCGLERAFALFTESASEWWPAERRHTPDPSSSIRMLESGRFWERAASGLEVELGRVRIWARPQRLVLDFFPGTDAEHPTEVEVLFSNEGEHTRVTIHHRPTEASKDLFPSRAPRYDQSWSLLLPALASAANRDS